MTAVAGAHAATGGRRELVPFAGSLVALQATRLACSLVVAATAPAAAFTAWTLVLAGMAYLPALTLGTLNGAAHEVPYLAGAGRAEDAAAAEAAMWAAAGAGAALPAAVLAGGLALLSSCTGFGNLLDVTGEHRRYLAVLAGALAAGAAAMAAGAALAGVDGLALVAAIALAGHGVALRRSALGAVR